MRKGTERRPWGSLGALTATFLPPPGPAARTIATVRIVHVNTERGWRGGEQQLLLLARGLRDVVPGIEQVVVAGPDTPLAQRARAADFEVLPISMRGALDRRARAALRRAFREQAPDLVHAHTSHGHSLAWGALRRGGPGPRPRLLVSRHVAYSIHRHVPFGLARHKYNRQCDALLCVSEAVREQLLADGVRREALHTVPNGIDPDAWRATPGASEALREGLGLADDAEVVGAIGALTPEKGHASLVDAFALLEPERKGRHLVLVGEGKERPALEAQITRHGLEAHVHLVGFQEDVAAWLGVFDLLAVPSLMEGFSLATLQGLAAERPVVASQVGGLAELFEDGVHARYVPPDDAARLAEALIELLEDRDLAARLAAAGADHVRARFHFHRTAEQTHALYEKVLAGAR